jgi:hypothetical protein
MNDIAASASSEGLLLRPRDLWRPIWSAEGWRCIATKRGERRDEDWDHSWWRGDEQAEDYALKMDLDALTWVYHACATYRQPGRRTQQNVLHLKCYWLDIDCGAGKPYRDLPHAWAALQGFYRRLGLPDPIVVISGNGLHAYWILAEAVAPDQWQPGAELLKLACKQLGLHADPSRTADCASVLRPPGTRNKKSFPPALVRGAVGTGEPIGSRTSSSACAADWREVAMLTGQRERGAP